MINDYLNQPLWIILFLLLLLTSMGPYYLIAFSLMLIFVIIGLIIPFHIIITHDFSSKKNKLKGPCHIRCNFLNYVQKRMRFLATKSVQNATTIKHITSFENIDKIVIEIIDYVIRDFINPWYYNISNDLDFINEIKNTLYEMIQILSFRCKNVDWISYLTVKLVDDIAFHLRLYRKTRKIIEEDYNKYQKPANDNRTILLFFEEERHLRAESSHEDICINAKIQQSFLEEITERFIYLLLPLNDFDCNPLRLIIREVFLNSILIPTLNLLSSPDFLNQTITNLCNHFPVSSDAFLSILKLTDSIEELDATTEKINDEISLLRSHDSGGENDLDIKLQLNSLYYVKRIIENCKLRLQQGCDQDENWKKFINLEYKIVDLSIEDILKNNIALSYFLDYLSTVDLQSYLFLYLNIQGWKSTCEQQISKIILERNLKYKSDNNKSIYIADYNELKVLQDIALNIYDQYMSDKVNQRIIFSKDIEKKLLQNITSLTFSATWFDDILDILVRMFNEYKFLPCFKKHSSYVHLLSELDLLKDYSKSDDEIDSVSLDGELYDSTSISSFELPSENYNFKNNFNGADFSLDAKIVQIRIIPDSVKPFSVYIIEVNRKDGHIEHNWKVERRYSDFYNFHQKLIYFYEDLASYPFPCKRAFNNLDYKFLEKRKKYLNAYLHKLLYYVNLHIYDGLLYHVSCFLEQGIYKKCNLPSLHKIDNIVKTSVRTALQFVFDSLTEIGGNTFDGITKILQTEERRVEIVNARTSNILTESEDNIPLRIFIYLMDEVFDLKSRNMWLRRRIIILLKQTVGNIYNQKIIEYVKWIISPNQIAKYLTMLKETVWPGGFLAEKLEPRDIYVRMRTRVAAKTLLLSYLSGDLKRLIGSETTRKGVICIFELFQLPILNRRLLIVILEGLLNIIFPDSKFESIFQYYQQRTNKKKI